MPGLELQQATLTNGSMHVSFKVNRKIDDENSIMNIALQDENNKAFYANGTNVEYLDEQTIVHLVFPYSVWNEKQSLSLSVDGYESLSLVSKE